MRDVPGVLVEHRDGGDELADETQRGVDVELEARGGGDFEDARQPRALRGLGDQGERRAAVHAVDAPDAGVVAVTEVGQPADPLAQHELEGLRADERVAEPQEFEGLRPGRVDGPEADSEPVGELVDWAVHDVGSGGTHGGVA